LGKFWRVLQWKMLVYFMDTWSISRSFVIFYGYLVYIVRGNLGYFFPFWYFVGRKIWHPCTQPGVVVKKWRRVIDSFKSIFLSPKKFAKIGLVFL
jgi:hypothetical protein